MKKRIDKENFPTIPSLVGTKVYLRPLKPDDTLVTYQWFLSSEPQSQTCHQVKLTSPEEYVARMKQREVDRNRGDFLIAAIDDERPVGKISFFDLNLLNRSAEIGFIVAPEERKNGYAYEGTRLLLGHLFNQLNLNKVYAQTGSFNTASVALLESLGFKRDGVLRQHHFYNGEFYDDYVYSLLKFECAF